MIVSCTNSNKKNSDFSTSAVKGVEVIRCALRTVPLSPGVYRMIGEKGEVLYIGKAASLKKRVTSYTHLSRLPNRLKQMVSQTVTMEIVTTHTEAEALLLEANYIKRMQPRFNILLRDDRSEPWLMLTDNHIFPRVVRHRGRVPEGVTLWGPFGSSWAADQTLALIQRIFLLRSCSDSVFNHRTRPCLQYQIKRCSAPCVKRIDQAEYKELTDQARYFLSGQNMNLRETLGKEMNIAADMLDFEKAAVLRDRIRALAQMQDSRVVNPKSLPEADVMGVWQENGRTCIQVFFIRGGHNNGSCSFFPVHTQEDTVEKILAIFIAQFYDNRPCPATVVINYELEEVDLLIEALSLKRGKRVDIITPRRGEKKQVLAHAINNARDALRRRLAETVEQISLLEGVAKVFGLEAPPERIEVYDNSHIQGTYAYGVMIVGGRQGFDRKAYRKFRIKNPVTPGDDFAMMREVLKRRFRHVISWPDIVLIDGGWGQYSAVRGVLDDLGITGVKLVCMAKGIHRNAGREWFYTDHVDPFQLPPRDPVLYYLQRLRDEAHRFAITAHRTGRSKALVYSELDKVPGIGPLRKKNLLGTFGSVRAVCQAGLADLEAVSGINRETARAVYGYFHPDWNPDEH